MKPTKMQKAIWNRNITEQSNLPVGGTGGSSTKFVAGIGIFSWPSEISSQTNLHPKIQP